MKYSHGHKNTVENIYYAFAIFQEVIACRCGTSPNEQVGFEEECGILVIKVLDFNNVHGHCSMFFIDITDIFF